MRRCRAAAAEAVRGTAALQKTSDKRRRRGSITDLCVNGLQAYRALISLLCGTALAMQQQPLQTAGKIAGFGFGGGLRQ